MNVIEVNTQKELKELIGTRNKMTTKIVSYEDYVSIEDLLVIKAQLKDLKCKMNNENFYIFTGKVFNDYVFSNRLKVPKAVREKYKLRGPKDMTFADAAKKAQKESEERPNDPISKRGLEDIMNKHLNILPSTFLA